MEWKESFSVGVQELNAQHREILELINKIGELADARNTGKSEAFGSLNAMIRYAEKHFKTEEDYLDKYGYPQSLQQKKEHETFVEEVFAMAHGLEEDGTLSLGTIIFYLQDWYTDHVLGSDQAYKEFLSHKLEGKGDAIVINIDSI
ncbi:MAG: bacteriohemerythrin [Syntrophobacteraceae bacterium]|jgi:hemerythrin-like metal-binding protein